MEIVAVKGEPRKGFGGTASKEVRSQGLIPCVLYGFDEVVHFSTDVKTVKPLIYTPDFKIAEVEIDGKTYKTILKDVQFHPVTDEIVHIDFLKLIDGHPVKYEVPVKFVGSSPGIKLGGKLLQNIRRVKIKATPETMVDILTLDISNLEMGQSIRIRDIEAVEGIEIMTPSGTPVATIEIPRALRSAAAAAKKEGAQEE
ncbi:MAG: 50S ribosomal protein L25 [Bacteroidota bacterium]